MYPKNLLFLVIILIIFRPVFGQDTTRVLFIGNSFTGANNLPELFKQLAINSGKAVYINAYTPGGISVGDTNQGNSAHMNNPFVFSLIRSRKWDYLVLQDNQGRFCLGYGQFPPSSRVIEGHLKIRDSLLFYSPCGRLVLYTGFGPKNGYPPYGNTGEALIDTIYNNYQFLNARAKELIAPIGAAFKQIMHHHPSMELWDTDATHPSKKGSYLAASVIYSSIFKSSPIVSTYNPGLVVSEDSIIKYTAFSTTVDSLNKTGLAGFTPKISIFNNRLFVESGSDCTWYLNNQSLNTVQNCELLLQDRGTYFVKTTGANGCPQKSFDLVITSIPDPKASVIDIYPNPAAGYFFVNATNWNGEPINVIVNNSTGIVIKRFKLIRYHQQISFPDLSAGVYFIQFHLSPKVVVRKLIWGHY